VETAFVIVFSVAEVAAASDIIHYAVPWHPRIHLADRYTDKSPFSFGSGKSFCCAGSDK